MDSVTLFERYDADLKELESDVTRKLATAATLTGEPRKQTIRAAQNNVDEIDDLVEQMEVEFRSLPQATRAKLQPRMTGHKTALIKFRQQLANAVVSSSAAERDELLAGSRSSGGAVTQEQRTRLLNANQRMSQSTQQLRDAHRDALEAEERGHQIFQDLSTQRETMLHVRDNLIKAEENIDKSSKILKVMDRRNRFFF